MKEGALKWRTSSRNSWQTIGEIAGWLGRHSREERAKSKVFLREFAIGWKWYDSLSSSLNVPSHESELTEAQARCTPPAVLVFNTILTL